MRDLFDSFPLALRLILRDPINFLLAVVPTVLALCLYLFGIVTIYRNSDQLASVFRGYVYTADQAPVLAKIATAILIVFVVVLMSWTFVLVVGLVAAPFNSLLSERIEKQLVQRLELKNQRILREISQGLWQVTKNELKKLVLLGFIGLTTFVLNLFPVFYPLGLFIVACMLAVQFLDYSWSRHNLKVGACLRDMTANLIPYSAGGFIFLLVVTVPIINAFVPAVATSYFTVLWIKRQNRPQLSPPQKDSLP